MMGLKQRPIAPADATARVTIHQVFADPPDDGHAPGAGRLRSLSLQVDAGLYHLVASPADGACALTALLLGQTEPRSGFVRVDGANPARSARLRARIAGLSWDPPTVGLGCVDDWLGLTTGKSGQQDLAESLQDLLQRPLRSLTLAERRRIDLAGALALTEPRLLILQEPFAITGVGRERLVSTLSQRAEAGCCVLVIAARVHELHGLGRCLGRLSRGQLEPLYGTEQLLRLALMDASGNQAVALVQRLTDVLGQGLLAVTIERHNDIQHLTLRVVDYEEGCAALQAACVAQGTKVLMLGGYHGASQPHPAAGESESLEVQAHPAPPVPAGPVGADTGVEATHPAVHGPAVSADVVHQEEDESPSNEVRS